MCGGQNGCHSIINDNISQKRIQNRMRILFQVRFLLTSAYPVGNDCGISVLASLASVMCVTKMVMSLLHHQYHLLNRLHVHRNFASPCRTIFQYLRMVWTVQVVWPNLAWHKIQIDRWLDDKVHRASFD